MDSVLYEETSSLILDGNALAGMLHEVFGAEMTIAQVECASCGRIGELGTLRVFNASPGYVLCCPACQKIVIRMIVTSDKIFLDARGTACLHIPKRR